MRTRYRYRLLGCALSMGLATWPFFPVSAQQQPDSPCDRELLGLASGRFPYERKAGGYCEGTYSLPVANRPRPRFEGASSGGLLEIVSVAARIEPFAELRRADTLIVDWPAFDGSSVSIRARTFEHRVHYQLDASVPTGTIQFRWPVRVLVAETIPWNRLGINVWGRLQIGNDTVPVHLPVTVWRRDTVQAEYTLVIVPSRTLDTLTISIGLDPPPDDSDGQVRDLHPVGGPPFFAGRPIVVPLQASVGGTYFIEIGAVSRGGGPRDAEELWVFLPNPLR